MNHKLILGGCAMALALAVAQPAGAQPPLGPPLHVGVTNGVVDEFGQYLKGTDDSAVDFGLPVVPGAVVQVLLANEGAFPPELDGTPSTNNPVIFQTRVGKGIDPTLGQIGLFTASVPNRPVTNRVIARVFNKDGLTNSSFYADSQLFTVSSTFNEPFFAEIQSTTTPMDTNEWDGDGLNNSWEKSLGTDPGLADTDSDGMGDGGEFAAGTDPIDPKSLREMVQLMPDITGDMVVFWDSVTGKTYQVQFTADELNATNIVYTDIGSAVLATGVTASLTVSNGMSFPAGHYRVKLVQP